MRQSQVFQASDPWAQAVADAAKDASGYLTALSQRDRAALLAETAAPPTAQERLQIAEQKESECNNCMRCVCIARFDENISFCPFAPHGD
jgi:hypothetical protein